MAEPEILNVPDTEAIAHFRAKGFHIGFDWRDTSAGQHVASFTVAKVARLNILQDIRTAMNRVKAEGRTFDDFRNELEPILRRKGWWGRQRMADPLTGQPRIVQLGSLHRLRIIFDTNLRMATAHGQWQRIERLAEVMPYLRYSAVRDARTRPEHLAWHGTVLPWDHPCWRTHYPPNGWRCRCAVQQLGEDDLERFGLKVSKNPQKGWNAARPWYDRRNDKIHQIPLGIDPGFAHNVGLVTPTAHAASQLAGKLKSAPAPLAALAARPDLDGYIARRRALRKGFVHTLKAGGIAPGDARFPGRFRQALTQAVKTERDAGTIEPKLRRSKIFSRDDRQATAAVRAATRVLPATWIERANDTRVRISKRGDKDPDRGSYRPADPNIWSRPRIVTDATPDNALHEYVHHLQERLPDFDDVFQQLHRRRTAGDPVLPLKGYGSKSLGRKDNYVDDYFGREYDYQDVKHRPAIKVVTRAFQLLFHPLKKGKGQVDLDKYLRRDPEMVDLAIGMLFHYDPPTGGTP